MTLRHALTLTALSLLACGGTAQPRGGSVSGEDPAAMAQGLIERLNRERAVAGLKPLEPHPVLASVAVAHSRDMAEQRFMAHDSPRTGSPVDRVHRAGLTSGMVLENVAQAGNVRALHDKFMATVGDRANLLNPQITHVGVGVVAREMRDDGPSMLYATEVFVRLAEEIDVATAPDTILRQLNASRRARGSDEMTRNPKLDEVAGAAARGFFADPSLTERATVDAANRELERFAIAYRRVAAVMAVVSALSEASALEPALDPGVRRVGVGVVQGDRPDTGPRAIAVVIVLGWPR